MAPCQGTEPAQDHPNGVAGIAFPKLFPDNSAVLWERNGTHSDKRTGSPSLNPSILAVYVAVCGCGWTIVRRTPSPPPFVYLVDFSAIYASVGASNQHSVPQSAMHWLWAICPAQLSLKSGLGVTIRLATTADAQQRASKHKGGAFSWLYGVPRADDRWIISGITFVICNGERECASGNTAPSKTFYNRFIRWSLWSVRQDFTALSAKGGKGGQLMIETTHLHRTSIAPVRGPRLLSLHDSRSGRSEPLIGASAADAAAGLARASGRPARGWCSAGRASTAPAKARTICRR